MFLTYEAFKFPAQLAPNATTWQAVEVMTVSPLFVVSIRRETEESIDTLLMASERDLLDLIEGHAAGAVDAVHVLFPPNHSPTRNWHLGCVSCVERCQPASGNSAEDVVFTLNDGSQFTGFPLHASTGEEVRRQRVPIAAFGAYIGI